MSNTGNIDSCLGLTKSQGHGPKKKKKESATAALLDHNNSL